MTAMFERPMSLAANTYSLLASMRVEPRIVRAYWTQNDSAIAMMRTVKAELPRPPRSNKALATPSMRRAVRMAGKGQLDVGDAHDERVEEGRQDSRRGARSATPRTRAKATLAKPTSNEMRMP